MYISLMIGVAALTATTSAFPQLLDTRAINGTNTTQPCGQIAAEVQSGISKHDTQTALACLKSVPFKLAPALITLESIRRLSEFQSSLEFIANPPPEYESPAVDTLAGLDNIEKQARNRKYTNEFDFEKDVSELFNLAADFHYVMDGSLVSAVLNFARPNDMKLISASKDGKSTPKIYMYSDALNPDASDITKINGGDAQAYLEKMSKLVNWNNPNARYNLMFFQTAYNDRFITEKFIEPDAFPGPTTSLTFSNGTTRTFKNHAWTPKGLAIAWNNIVDGESLYQTFVNPRSRIGSAISQRDTGDINPFTAINGAPSVPPKFRVSPDERPEVPTYYPDPALEFNLGFPKMSGYFINAGGQSNVAVLSLPTFEDISQTANQNQYITGFLQFMQSFINECKRRKSPRLMIDIRGNGGGIVALGLNAFRMLFPSTEYFQGTRIRISNASTASLEAFAKIPPGQLTALQRQLFIGEFNPFDFRSGLDVSGKPFTSAADKIGSNVVNEGEHVSEVTLTGDSSLISQVINGTDPFKAEDVLLLSDGECGSTGARFAEMLTNDVQVRTLTVGGIPRAEPMAFAGGSKGAQVLKFQDFFGPMSQVLRFALPKLAQLGQVAASTAQSASQFLPISPGITMTASINVLDQIRKGDTTPTQFRADNAECRIWYTPEMYAKPETLWQAAYKATWTDAGKELCVAGAGNTASSGGASAGSLGGSGTSTTSTTSGDGGSGGGDSAGAHTTVGVMKTAFVVMAIAMSLM